MTRHLRRRRCAYRHAGRLCVLLTPTPFDALCWVHAAFPARLTVKAGSS